MEGLDNNYQNVETLNTPSPETGINVTSNVTGVSRDSMLSLYTVYTKMMVEMRDPRTDGWFMMSSVWPTVILSASYYLIVRHVGPWFMATR